MDIEQLISQYLDGELSSEAEGEFHQKLSISPEARALFREHLKLQSIARDERVLHQPTASMQSALFARLQEEEGMAPVGALPLIEEEEAPSPAHSPIISPTKPRAVPTPSGDRTSVASVDDQRSEERRRKRRLIPILIPLMLLCIVGGVFLVDGNFFGGGKNGEEIAYNAQAQEESAERATAPLSDRDYSDPANPVTTTTPVPEKTSSTPENSGSGTIALNTGGNRKNDSPQLSSKKSTTKALTIEPDEASLAALSTEERSALEIEPAYKLSPSPKRVSPRSEQESDLYEKESEDAYSSFSYDPNTDSDDWNSKNEDPANDLAYDYDAQDSEVTTDFTNLTDSDNYETLDAIAPSMPLQDGLSLTMRPETRSKSNIAEDKDREATKSEETAPALILNMTESSTDKPVLATIDNQEATLDLLKQNGITIDPTTLTFSVDNPGFNIRGGRGNAPLVEQHSGFEILERTADSVRIGYGIGRAAAQNMQTSFTLSTEEFDSLGGVDRFGEGLSLARDGAAVSNAGIQLWNTGSMYDNTGNIYQQDSILNRVATNATTYSVGNQKWQSTTNLPNASSPILGEGSQVAEENKGVALLSEAPLNNSASTISVEEKGSTFFIGIEGSIAAGLNSSEASFLNSRGVNGGGSLGTQISFGVDLDHKKKHRLFGTIGLAPYSEREISRIQTTSRTVELLTERVVFVDASGVNQTTQSITRERISTSTSTSVRDAERSIIEMWGGIGYRFSLPLVREWKAGLEVVGGIGTTYLHAGFSIPISYALGNALRVEFKPGMHYRTTYSASEPVTTGTLDPTASSSSRIETTQGPAEETRLDAGAGIGLILFLR